jgi:hypothetical protein
MPQLHLHPPNPAQCATFSRREKEFRERGNFAPSHGAPMKFLLRLIWVAIAALVASLAGLAFMLVYSLELLARTAAAETPPDGTIAEGYIDAAWTVFNQAGALLPVATAFTLVPGLIVLIVAEVARIRSLTYYLAAGGIAFAALPVMLRLAGRAGVAGAQMPWQTPFLLLIATAGFLAGAVYWVLAGRRA